MDELNIAYYDALDTIYDLLLLLPPGIYTLGRWELEIPRPRTRPTHHDTRECYLRYRNSLMARFKLYRRQLREYFAVTVAVVDFVSELRKLAGRDAAPVHLAKVLLVGSAL